MTTRTIPGTAWERGPENADVTEAANALLADPIVSVNLALVVVQHGRVIFEAYGPDTTPNSFREGPPPDTTATSTLISWSMAKSITQALVGLALEDGLVSLDTPAAVPSWKGTDREAITLQQLLNMRSGLRFVEDYVDGSVSNVIEMLFGDGKDDIAAYASSMPLDHRPGDVWSYSSGTTNIICRILGDAIGGGVEGMRAYIEERLFKPIGITSAIPKFDPAGTFIGSSFVYATALDFARFGLLYLHDGWWGEHRILPPGWVDHARRATPTPEGEPHGYGAHWWLWPYDGALACHGYEGQRTIVLPDRDAVVVRLGKTNDGHADALRAHLHAVIRALPIEG